MMHAISKIIARHADRKKSSRSARSSMCVPDYVMLNDRGAARAADLLRKMGGDKVFDPEQVVVVFDHHYPPIRQQDSVSQKQTREWIKEQGITKFHAGEGIGHVIFPEKGYAFPGALIFGTDSHTVTNSALGCVATGMGHSDIASYLALGYNWLRVPEVIRFDLHGEFQPGVYAKDIALRIAQLYGEDAAPYLGVEFAGPLIAKHADGGAARPVQHGDRFRRQDRIHPARRNHRALHGAARADFEVDGGDDRFGLRLRPHRRSRRVGDRAAGRRAA